MIPMPPFPRLVSVVALFSLVVLSGCGAVAEPVSESDLGNAETTPYNEDSVNGNDADSFDEGSLPEETFTYDSTLGYYGGILLKGYLSVDTKACSFQDISECKVDVAWFHFENPHNDFFEQFIEEGTGNSFLASGAISLGCYDGEGSRIYYNNAADVEGFLSGEIRGEAFTALMATRDQGHDVNLWVEKPVLTSGKGADDCYSHFRNFDVIE